MRGHRWMIPFVLLLGACSGMALVSVAADPFAARYPSAVSYEEVSAASEQFRAEFARIYGPSGALSEDDPNYYLFRDVLGLVLARHVRAVDPFALSAKAIEGLREAARETPPQDKYALTSAALDHMLRDLDPYSAYLDSDDYQDLQAQTKGEFGGLGLELTYDPDEELVKVVSPIDNTPAARAGIRAGDLITHIDGVSLKGTSLHDTVVQMRGEPGTSIGLRVRRPSQTSFDVQIVRAVIQIDPVRHRVERSPEGNVAYVRVTAFNERSAEELDAAMADIRRATDGRVAGIVLDLRNNPGGLLNEAVDLAGRFLEDGFEVVSVRGRDASDDYGHRSYGSDIAQGIPMVVLINGASASASEIVAGALQDYRRALVFGTRSYGKGSVQSVHPLGGGDALRLTTARYFRPSGGLVDCFGIEPNLEIWLPPSTGPESEPHQDPSRCDPHATRPPPPVRIVPAQVCPRGTVLKNDGGEDDRVIGCAVEALREYLVASQPTRQ